LRAARLTNFATAAELDSLTYALRG
jgi:hypothetical protein